MSLALLPHTLSLFLSTGGVYPLHFDEFWDKKWEDRSPGHGGGWPDLSPHTLRHYHQTAGGHTGLHSFNRIEVKLLKLAICEISEMAANT